MKQQIQIQKLFAHADGVVILAGAGMSVDSGLPDFRGASGMWTQAKQDFITNATAAGFDENPLQAWNFYIERMLAYAHVQPHTGYHMLLHMLHEHNKPYFVVTTNVDQHFVKAGFDPQLILELHGSLSHTQCVRACTRQLHAMPRFTCTLHSQTQVPQCDLCGLILRPNVMMFSDPYLVWHRIDQGQQRYRDWCVDKLNVLGIEIGAGTTIPSLRYWAEEKTASLIRINTSESETQRPQDVALSDTALEGIKFLITCVSHTTTT